MPKGDKTKKPQASTKGKDRLQLAVKEYIKGIYIEREQGYTWVKALRTAGYTDAYALGHCSDLRKRANPAIDKAKTELFKEQKMNLADWDDALRDFHNRCVELGDRSNEKAAIDMGMKRNNGFVAVSMDITKESPIPEAEQDQITQAAKELTVKLARNTA